MMIYRAEKRTVKNTGVAIIGWEVGYGYIKGKLTITRDVWCVVGDDGLVKAECRGEKIAKSIAKSMNDSQGIKPHA